MLALIPVTYAVIALFGTTIGSYDTTIRLWDCRSQLRAPIQILEEPKDSITSIKIKGSDLLAG